MERSNDMSLKVLAIILAMLGLLVGYLLGNWFIQLVTGDSPGDSHLADTGNKVVEEEIILDDNQSEESSSENVIMDSTPMTEENKSKAESEKASNTIPDNQIKSDEVFVIQVGAFNSLQNAKQLGKELEDKGFQVIIADESSPYKVQIGAFPDKDKAKEMEKKVKALGYETFITH